MTIKTRRSHAKTTFSRARVIEAGKRAAHHRSNRTSPPRWSAANPAESTHPTALYSVASTPAPATCMPTALKFPKSAPPRGPASRAAAAQEGGPPMEHMARSTPRSEQLSKKSWCENWAAHTTNRRRHFERRPRTGIRKMARGIGPAAGCSLGILPRSGGRTRFRRRRISWWDYL